MPEEIVTSKDGVALELGEQPGLQPVKSDEGKAIAVKTKEGEPEWLPARLERERRAILKDLGVEDVGTAKAALAELKTKQDAAKSSEQKAAEASALAADLASKVVKYEAALKTQATASMARLTDEQRAAVTKIAEEDPARQLSAIEALSPTWSRKPDAAVTTTVTTKVADTAPPGKQPMSPPPTQQPTELATWETLKASNNPFLAASYLLNNRAAISEQFKNKP